MSTKNKSKSSITNFYTKKEVKAFSKSYDNKNYNSCYIKHPFRLLLVGSSGSGKTNTALEIIRRLSDTFDFVVLVCKDASEPLYQYLQSKLQDLLYIFEDKIPSIQEISKLGNSKSQILVLYDDLVNTKNQSLIQDAFIRARKLNRGISLMYLSQSYFKIPKIIRLQANYVILKKVSNMRDIRLLCTDYDCGRTKEQLTDAYTECVRDGITSFLTIRIDHDQDDPLKFTKNFDQPI